MLCSALACCGLQDRWRVCRCNCRNKKERWRLNIYIRNLNKNASPKRATNQHPFCHAATVATPPEARNEVGALCYYYFSSTFNLCLIILPPTSAQQHSLPPPMHYTRTFPRTQFQDSTEEEETADESSSEEDSSSSDEDHMANVQRPEETLLQGRSRRKTAGTRMAALLNDEEDEEFYKTTSVNTARLAVWREIPERGSVCVAFSLTHCNSIPSWFSHLGIILTLLLHAPALLACSHSINVTESGTGMKCFGIATLILKYLKKSLGMSWIQTSTYVRIASLT